MKTLKQLWEEFSGERFNWPVVTLTLIGLNLMAWCAVAWFYHLSLLATQNSALLLRVGAVNGDLLRAGEWWRIITSQFLHVHLLHMLFNMLAVLLLGIMLERALGSWRLLLLYIVSGTIGQLAGVMSTPALVSSGASQAAVGLAGGMFIQWLRQSRKKSLSLIALLFIVGVQMALDLISSGRIKAGHLAGFCAGAAITYFMSRSLKEKI